MSLTLEHRPLGQLLLSRGILASAQLDGALEQQRRAPDRRLLGEILVDSRLCTEEQVAEALAQSCGVPFARVRAETADPEVIARLPRQFLEREQVLPLSLEEGVLTVAVTEPANVFLLDEIARLSGCRVKPVVATPRDIAATLRAYLPDGRMFVIDDVPPEVGPDAFCIVARAGQLRGAGASPNGAANANGGNVPSTPDDLADAADRLIRACLYNAIRQSATDVHIEPGHDCLRVRYRIDGRLVERFRPPPQIHAALLARLKSMAGVDPAQRPLPQAGPLPVRVDGRTIELRVTFAPAAHGERAVIHLSNAAKSPLRLEKLGFGYETLKQWRKLIASTSGLLLVSGPAGSGKQTTLYATLREMNLAERNVCTVEDPIEQFLDGASQFQVDDRAGFDTDAALRAVLAQRPDVVMVPNGMTPEVARRAAGAAVGGCLVLASVHAPDVPSAIARVLKLGVEPFALHASLAGVLCQRLVRRLCQECREAYEPTETERKPIEKVAGPTTTLYRARPGGCARCAGAGYTGRIGLYELLTPDDALTEAIGRAASLPELREIIRRTPTKSLRTDAAEKIKSGVTTLTEFAAAMP